MTDHDNCTTSSDKRNDKLEPAAILLESELTGKCMVGFDQDYQIVEKPDFEVHPDDIIPAQGITSDHTDLSKLVRAENIISLIEDRIEEKEEKLENESPDLAKGLAISQALAMAGTKNVSVSNLQDLVDRF